MPKGQYDRSKIKRGRKRDTNLEKRAKELIRSIRKEMQSKEVALRSINTELERVLKSK